MKLSRASYRKMQENLVWAVGYNVFAISLAAGVLAPIGVVLSPAVGALLMSLSTVIVAIDAQFLRRVDLTVPSLPGSGIPPVRDHESDTGSDGLTAETRHYWIRESPRFVGR